MNTITLTLCASTRTGCLSAPIHSCADERLTLAGDVTLSAGTSVALITPRGYTLANTILSEECAPGATIPLSTLTAQAAEYTRSCRAGDTREAILAVGDSEHPLALIPARIAQNPLYTLAPPAALAPAYPTTEALKSLLAEMQSASNAAAQSAAAARKSAEAAGESASSAASDRATAVYAATSAQAYAEVATAAQARSSTYAAEASTSAANAASSAASAQDSASSAISASNSAAGSASKAAASADSAASALTASTDAANRAEVAAANAHDADISAANSATAASQSATAAAQEAAEGVTALLQGKVDAAEAAKAGAEAAKTAAETAKTGAEAAKAAAASSATAAANSAAAAAKSATDLADAVATAESLDGRILRLEKGKGVYQASDGSIQIYTPFDLCNDGTLKVVKTVGKFRSILPVEVEESSTIFFAGDHNYIYFLVGTGVTFKNRLFVYDHNFNRIANYHLPFLVPSYFGGCYRNDRLYIAKGWYGFAVFVLDKSGTVLKSFVPEISEEGATPVEDNGNSSMFFYNPKSGHMCCFSPQPNGNGRPSYLFAFDDDLNQIVEEDGTYRVRSFRLDTRFCMQAAVIHGTAYLFPIRGGNYEYEIKNCPVFRVTEDDSLEIVRESIPRTDEEGNILYMTEQVTDEEGNVTEEIARDEWNRNILLPQTDDGDEIRYNVAISDKESRPLLTAGGAFRIRPIVRYSNVLSGGQYKAVTYFDGVDAYLILKDGRWIDLWRLNNPFDGTAKKLRTKNDRSSAFTKKTMRIFSCGTQWQVWGSLDINNALVYDSASTVPFSNYHSLSVQVNGSVTRGADILFDLSVGTPLSGEYQTRNINCLVYDGIPSACIFGGRPWTSTYNNIIGGGY